MDLDDFDRRLLTLVQSDAGQTAEQLAGHVGLSASASSSEALAIPVP